MQDRSGQIQMRLERDRLPEGVYQTFKKWDVGDIVGANGELFRTKTGELTVMADEVRLITKSLRPLPEKFHGLADQETRYRQRYVDLIMNEASADVFRIRSADRFLYSSVPRCAGLSRGRNPNDADHAGWCNRTTVYDTSQRARYVAVFSA